MSTATLPATIEPQETALSAETLERLVIGGDLSKLSPTQRLEYYRARCEAAGLDVRTQPFQYITLQGKLTLYATKTATDQLIAIHRLTVEIPDRGPLTDLSIYEARCRVTFADGHHVEDLGVVSIAGLKAEALCNAILKAITKAKRRTVLSACGLGMLDETELETIPGAQASNWNREPVPAELRDADPRMVEAYEAWLRKFTDKVNSQWIDHWTGEGGEIHPAVKDLVTTFQLTGHLLKWATSIRELPELPPANHRHRLQVAAKLFHERGDEVVTEARNYVKRLSDEFKAKVQAEAGPKAIGHDDLADADPDIDYDNQASGEGEA